MKDLITIHPVVSGTIGQQVEVHAVGWEVCDQVTQQAAELISTGSKPAFCIVGMQVYKKIAQELDVLHPLFLDIGEGRLIDIVYDPQADPQKLTVVPIAKIAYMRHISQTVRAMQTEKP